MKLGELITTLSNLPPSLPVKMHEETGLAFCSWRGDYKQVSLYHYRHTALVGKTKKFSYGDVSFDDPVEWRNINAAQTVGELLHTAREVSIGSFEGYKGGVFKMNTSVDVYADDYGSGTGHMVIGILIKDDAVVHLLVEGPYDRYDR